MLVGFGQKVCLPVGPRCDLCDLAAASPSLCPSARKVSPKKPRAKKEESPPKVEIEIEGAVKAEEGLKVEEDKEGTLVQSTVKPEEEEVFSSVKAELASPVKGGFGW